ncbi:MAG: ATP-binding protein [Microvirga sp.]
MTQAQGRHPFLLSTAAPNPRQWRMAISVLTGLMAALLLAAPFARLNLPGTEILIPAYAAAAFLVELLTAALLFALFSVDRSRAVLFLGCGYLFSGLLALPWALTFPGVFASLGMEANLQVTPVIAAARRLGFALCILAYAFSKDREPGRAIERVPGRVIADHVALVSAAAALLSLAVLLGTDHLPPFMRDTRDVAPLWSFIPAASVTLYLAGIARLSTRRRSTLDLWLIVVLGTLLIEIVLISYLGGATRLSVGWWAGRCYALTSASVVLLVLLSETVTLQARLDRSVRSEHRARESRLTAMEALSASIAHEINQPLASMVTNASAGVRWLDKDIPRVEEARSALERVVRDGHRAREVVDSIRNLFKKDARERVPLDLNQLIKTVLRQCRTESRFGQISIEDGLGETPLLVTANPLQLQQVVSNLVANAIDAMDSITSRRRILRVRSRLREGEVVVSVEDTGLGIMPEARDRIFDPFFSTKPEGMGMGLMFSRSIIEDHGGRLWADDNAPHGAVFHFMLPCQRDPGAPDTEAPL